MRTTFLSESRQLLFNLRQSQERRHDANVQLASGLRVTKPSDLPSDAAAVVRTSTDLKVLHSFEPTWIKCRPSYAWLTDRSSKR